MASPVYNTVGDRGRQSKLAENLSVSVLESRTVEKGHSRGHSKQRSNEHMNSITSPKSRKDHLATTEYKSSQNARAKSVNKVFVER